MKKRNLKSLKLNKESISNIQTTIFGGEEGSDTTYYDTLMRSFLYNNCPGPLPLTADVLECPDNSLNGDCSLGYCPESFWC